MLDRVVDPTAGRAAPAQLAIRDWLLVALSFASGCYEAICFLTFGKVFSGFQTGNIVFLGVGLAGTRPPAGPNAVSVVISLAAFALGAVLAVAILKRFDGDQEVEDKDVVHVWPRRVSITLGAVLIVQLGFLAAWLTVSPSTEAIYLMLALNAFGMGAQMNAVRSLHVPGISTTAATATFISLVSSIANRSLTGPAARRLAGEIAAIALGALLADWMLGHAYAYAALPPAIVIAIVVATASTVLKRHKAGSAPTLHPLRSSRLSIDSRLGNTVASGPINSRPQVPAADQSPPST
jgi:uncharacterized membrane protein YoaK (UPF0700 family)